ncbi:MAG: hypothetical protein MAG715_00232 [Methanonatronarchaeales archaeon]|nr:hypothetical protein [Methanonatronarchaeales archaeon]
MRLMGDDSAVSTTFSYVLMFAITTIIFTSVMWIYSESAEQARERAMRKELIAIGEEVAGAVADSQFVDTSNGTVEKRLDLPSTVGGEGYTVRFDEGSGQVVVTSSTGVEVQVTMNGLEGSVDFRGPIYSSSFEGSRQGG